METVIGTFGASVPTTIGICTLYFSLRVCGHSGIRLELSSIIESFKGEGSFGVG
jgi:hypothetical protein